MRTRRPKETAPSERLRRPGSRHRAQADRARYRGPGRAWCRRRRLIPDAAFTDAGAQLTDDQAAVWGADAVVTIAPPAPADIARMREGALLVGFLQPLTSTVTAVAARDAKVTALAMEAIPRISRAQAMDALSSQSNVAGYAAVCSPPSSMQPLLPDADDRRGHDPAGQGARARRGRRRPAGARDRAPPRRASRPATTSVPRSPSRSQSLGAKFLDLGIEAAGEGGYARELTAEERAAQQQALTDAIKGFDVVITTALVPGRPAPKLVSAEAVEGMKPGSVIVDLAGESGGNCELTEPGQTASSTTSRSSAR